MARHYKSEDALKSFIERSDRRLSDRLRLYFPKETKGYNDHDIALAYWKWLTSDTYTDTASEADFTLFLGGKDERRH